MNPSTIATLWRWETLMSRWLDCVQRTPIRSQYSQNSPRMSAESCRAAASPSTRIRATSSPLRVTVDDRALPVGQDDRPLVLAAGAVLRECLAPVRRVAVDHEPAVATMEPCCDAMEQGGQLGRGNRLVDDLGIGPVEGEAQTVRAGRRPNPAVAEVEAE
jgi:hypothetical protein